MTPGVSTLSMRNGHIGKIIRIMRDLCALIHSNSVRTVAIKTHACNCVHMYLLMWEKHFGYVKVMPLC